ncbi:MULTISPECIES: ROK family transcriptional regulator [Asticcacaulis]|jgi:predicted NBD/HSP70 family sugar kinase|uniref:ROK family transcriptional regulator n=1 Tax=Asticcacaulis TaxID=76890 RepID=UPI001AE28374|nr:MULTISPECIES: ROK family transcriptional regulator [Asticcacaulis]MBP2160506.1 putative NBD/HSP70 family sugar kinase [Asticcacaulis solisilvae]MDR6801551.1 putative NBD/HSP70 family sugar kinase [Asticcacaulis sp. BE141]
MPLGTQKRSIVSFTGTNLERAGDHNQRVVLQTIRTHGPVTRSELASLTGLTHQSIVNITRRLLEDGLIKDEGALKGTRGQPAARLAVESSGAYTLGLNIDRDHLTFVVMDLAGQVLRRVYARQRFALPNDVIGFLGQEIAKLYADRVVPRKRVLGLGIAIPERLAGVDVAERPANYDVWQSLDVVETFSEALGLSVYVENDATSAAIGELQFGQGLTQKSFVYTLISAGVGCGLVIEGQPYAGGLTHAGEIGNIPIPDKDGHPRTLWDVLSLFAFYDELGRRGVVLTDAADILEDDEATIAGVDAWIEEAVTHMIAPFLAVTYILSPESLVIGGQLPGFVIRRLCDRLNERLENFKRNIPLTPFRPSTVSIDAAAMGAAVLVLQKALLPTPEAMIK